MDDDQHIFYSDGTFTNEFGETRELGWYFWDETQTRAHGPYASKSDAQAALNRYAEYLDGCPICGLPKEGTEDVLRGEGCLADSMYHAGPHVDCERRGRLRALQELQFANALIGRINDALPPGPALMLDECVRRLITRLAMFGQMLADLEWRGRRGSCPSCGQFGHEDDPHAGHAAGCPLDNALRSYRIG